ncbi:MBL fold metallo-hydrolase [Salinifilum ghardaiensis]
MAAEPAAPSAVPVSARCTAYLQLPGGWFLNNAGWVRGEDRTLLVDTCATEARSRRLLAALRADGGGLPLTAALTHAHGDHANGAGLVAADGGAVVATPPAAAEVGAGPHTFPMLVDYDNWGAIDPPEVIEHLDGPVERDLGGVTARLEPVPQQAHTDGDLVVAVPGEGVVYAGDLLFNGVTPLAAFASVPGWLRALEWLEGFGATCLVPGHGPIPEDPATLLADMRAYLRWLLDVADETTPDFAELEQQARDGWPGWHDAERHAVNLRVAHAQVRAQEVPVDELLSALSRAAGGAIRPRLDL